MPILFLIQCSGDANSQYMHHALFYQPETLNIYKDNSSVYFCRSCIEFHNYQVAEISRVLRSGGVFVGTTFLSTPVNSPFSSAALRPLRQVSSDSQQRRNLHRITLYLIIISVLFLQIFGQVTNSYSYFTAKEIEDLCKTCGLVNYTSKIQRAFIMFTAQKP